MAISNPPTNPSNEFSSLDSFNRIGEVLIKRLSSIAVGHIFIMGNLTIISLLLASASSQRVGFVLSPNTLLIFLWSLAIFSVISLIIMVISWLSAPK